MHRLHTGNIGAQENLENYYEYQIKNEKLKQNTSSIEYQAETESQKTQNHGNGSWH